MSSIITHATETKKASQVYYIYELHIEKKNSQELRYINEISARKNWLSLVYAESAYHLHHHHHHQQHFNFSQFSYTRRILLSFQYVCEFLIELEFGSGEGKPRLPGEKATALRTRERTNDKLNPHVASMPELESGPHCWE